MSENVVIKKDRTVTVPASEAKIGVQYDHNVNVITFDCPRYPDDDRSVDLSTMQIYINYMLPDKTLGSYLAENVKVDTNNPDTIHFDWKITRNVTQVKGALQALVCIKKVDAEGNELYHWNTDLIQSFRVGEGMECLETISSDYADVISQLLVNMNTVTGEFEALSADVTARTSEETLQGLVNNAASDEKLRSIVDAYMEANPVGINVDDTLAVSGDAADAKITGDRITELKSDLGELVDDLNKDGTYIYKKNKVNSEYSSVRDRYEINVPAKEGNNTIYCPDMGNETLTTYLLNSDKSAIGQRTVTFSNGLASFAGVSNTAYIRVFGNNITSSSVGYSNVKTRDSVRRTLTEHSNAIDTNASAITTTDKRVDVLDYYYENGVEGDGAFNYIVGEYSAEYDSAIKKYKIFVPIENEDTIYLYCSDISNGTYNGMILYSDDEKTHAVATVDVTFTNGYSAISVNKEHKWFRLVTYNIKESSVCYKLEKKTAIRKEINDLKAKTVTTNVDRYLFVSDIHFGFSGDYSPDTHVSQLLDAIRTENEIKKLKAVFIVGDLISNTESYNFKSYAKKFVKSIKEMGIKVFVLHGNHDCWSPDDFRKQFENSMDFVVNTPNLRYECVNTWGTDYYTGDLNLITADMKDVDENVAQYMLSTRDSKPTIVVSHYPTNKTNFMSLLTDEVICLFGGHVHSPKVSDFNGKTLYLDGSISTIEDGKQYRTFRILECAGGNITTYVVAPKLEMFNQTERVVDEAVLLYTKGCDVYDIN